MTTLTERDIPLEVVGRLGPDRPRPTLPAAREGRGIVFALVVTLGFTNALFAAKYLARTGEAAPFLVVGYLVAYSALLLAAARLRAPRLDRPWAPLLVAAAVTLGSILLFQYVDYAAIRVDRWSAIELFWRNVVEGVYPYHHPPGVNMPGPLPFYHVLALPFVPLGEGGYFALAGFLGYAYLAYRLMPSSRARVLALLALVLSLPFIYEIAVRSTIVVMSVLVALFLYAVEARKPETTPGFLLAGFIGGLVLSTRSVAAIPILLYMVYAFGRTPRWNAFLTFGAALAFSFVLTFVPLYLSDPAAFWQYNPVLHQSGLSRGPVVVLALAATVLLGFRSTSLQDVFAYSALLLFSVVLISSIDESIQEGLAFAVFESGFDISYFSLGLPFATLVLGQRLGRGREADE